MHNPILLITNGVDNYLSSSYSVAALRCGFINDFFKNIIRFVFILCREGNININCKFIIIIGVLKLINYSFVLG